MAAESEPSYPTQIPAGEPGEYHYAFYGAGFMPGYVIKAETLRKVRELDQRAQEKKDKKQRPPKPPSRPNARIGDVALGSI
ncbi:MAG TPA: hypothetical protein VMT23_01700 [Candidatus Binatia bacterium]|nr:hypothetical protein [Candidatus Binatia bacterium]